MERPSIEEVILQWKTDRIRIPTEDEGRIAAYLDLFRSLESYGYSKADVKRSSVFNHIIFHSHNPNSKNGKKWGDNCIRTLNTAIARKWPIAMLKHDPADDIAPIVYAESQRPDPAGQESEDAPKALPQRPFTKEEWDKVPDLEPEYDPDLRKLLGFDT